MSKIVVSGLVNIETTLRIDRFPIVYSGVTYPFFGINSSISGVGFNVASALTTLGNEARLLTVSGADLGAERVAAALGAAGISAAGLLPLAAATAESVILYDSEGRRQIYTDLKDVQDVAYPRERFRDAAAGCTLAALGNINFSRPLLDEAARMNLPIATDVHAVHDLADPYNAAFMAAAHILFMSHERLPMPPAAWVRQIWQRYGAEIVVIGLGADGALLGVRADRRVEQFPAPFVRPVVNTVGAGDALFSGFLHAYAGGATPWEALRAAQVFAAYKIGASGGAAGFLDAPGLAAWQARLG